MTADLSSQIEEAAADPQSVTVDGQTVSSRPLSELIEADRYLASKAAARARKSGFRISKIIPPGMAGT